MKKITGIISPIAAATLLLAGAAAPASAAPWLNKKVKCTAVDPDGREIPTLIGNAELGWNHFTGRHNIRKCDLLNIPMGSPVDKKSGANLEYWGYATNREHGTVKIVVKARYARKTDDGRYDAGSGKKIGVITAYCKGMQKCPNWVNQ
ncbi:hypothetical protein OHT20_18565 [Streptomyces caniferus]|uniref:Uncharacterized protein n=1 Tax=Streptomyces caniferus TaxID=285557 RepID=A0A640SJC1_9ACTN|nr:hypothetical protein [Streptomyces caniferus]GFE11327.1 hypothetical protein Scani_75950 [Streptomyces caniferus]